jgi:lipoprotein signal peptidase
MSVLLKASGVIAFLVADQVLNVLLQWRFPELIHSELFFAVPTAVRIMAGFSVLVVLVLWKKHNGLAFPFLIAGFLANLTTLFLYGHYIDYIPTGISYINTADLIIGAGCILLFRERGVTLR